MNTRGIAMASVPAWSDGMISQMNGYADKSCSRNGMAMDGYSAARLDYGTDIPGAYQNLALDPVSPPGRIGRDGSGRH